MSKTGAWAITTLNKDEEDRGRLNDVAKQAAVKALIRESWNTAPKWSGIGTRPFRRRFGKKRDIGSIRNSAKNESKEWS